MNRAALRTQFKALLNRSDCSNTLADTFIDQALSRIQRTLRVPAMEKATTVTFSDTLPNAFILPEDFLEFIDIYYHNGTSSHKLRPVPLGRFLEVQDYGGVPQFYSRFGPEIRVKPAASEGTELTLLYYAEVPDFTDDSSTNWLSEVAPELLIYGALSFACDYFVDERKGGFEEVYTRTYQELEEQARSLEFSGGELMVQPMYKGDY